MTDTTSKSRLSFLLEPKNQARFHACMVLVWLCLIIPSLLFWKDSVTWVIIMSLWANVAAHWSSYQAAHGERRVQEKDEEDDEANEASS